jgi:excisionase family DNA binding protein
MTVNEAARALKLSYTGVRILLLMGKLKGFQLNGRYGEWRISRESVLRYRRRRRLLKNL